VASTFHRVAAGIKSDQVPRWNRVYPVPPLLQPLESMPTWNWFRSWNRLHGIDSKFLNSLKIRPLSSSPCPIHKNCTDKSRFGGNASKSQYLTKNFRLFRFFKPFLTLTKSKIVYISTQQCWSYVGIITPFKVGCMSQLPVESKEVLGAKDSLSNKHQYY